MLTSFYKNSTEYIFGIISILDDLMNVWW